MNRNFFSVLLLCMSAPVYAECEGDLNRDCRGDDSYLMIGQGLATGEPDRGDMGTCGTICTPPNSLLPAPVVTCIRNNLFFECEVWPQARSLRYQWRATANLRLATDGLPPSASVATPYQAFSCRKPGAIGRASVTVFKGTGEFTQREFEIPCLESDSLPTPVGPDPQAQ